MGFAPGPYFHRAARANATWSISTGCGPLSMEIVSLPRLCRIIDRDPIVFEQEYRASALPIESHVNSRINSIRIN